MKKAPAKGAFLLFLHRETVENFLSFLDDDTVSGEFFLRQGEGEALNLFIADEHAALHNETFCLTS